jgi:hypothetical protein
LGFDPKKPPPKTQAFWNIVDANRSPEDSDLADVLDLLGNPEATTLQAVIDKADTRFAEWLMDHKNRRNIPCRLGTAVTSWCETQIEMTGSGGLKTGGKSYMR